MDQKEFEAMKELVDKKKKLLDTTELVHSEAYDKTARKLLLNTKGEIDYDKLKDSKVQKEFGEALKDHYLSAAKEGLGIKEHKKGELYEEMLLDAYMGVTSAHFKNEIAQLRHNYTKKRHAATVDKLIQNQDAKLKGVIFNRVTHDDIKDVIGYIEQNSPDVQGKILTDKVSRDEAIGLLDAHYSQGLTEKAIEGAHYHKKKAA